MRYADIISGLGVTILGVAILVAIGTFPVLPTADVGPAFFPKLVGILLISTGLLLAGLSFYKNKNNKKIKDLFNKGSLFALGTMLIFGIYIFIIKKVGFLISTPALIIGLAYYLKGEGKIIIIVASIAVTLFIYYIFSNLLLIPLPKGIFF